MNGRPQPPTVRIDVLGPVQVTVDGRTRPLRGPKAMALLLRLLVADGRPVSTWDLRDDVWPEQSPSDSTLRVTVGRLRSTLGDDGPDPRIIRHEHDGYLLDRSVVEVDVDRFRALVAEARELTDPSAAIARYEEALALWRGRAFAGLSFATVDAEHLESEREAAVEERLAVAVAAGGAGELVAELEAAVADQPLREHRTASLMVALYRAGRQADALAAYRRLETLLREDLGLSPGTGLRDLELRVVCQDPTLLERSAGSVDGAGAEPPIATARAAIALARRGVLDQAARLVGEAVERARATSPAELAACLVDQAQVLGAAGNPSVAVAAADEAIAIARRIGDAVILGRAAMVRFGFGVSLDDALVVNLLEPLDLLPPDSPVRVELLCAAMHQLAVTGTPAETEPLVREAVDIADRLGDPSARAVADIGRAILAALGGESAVVTNRLAREAVASAERSGEPRLVVTALHAELRDLLAVGDVDGLEGLLERFDRAADVALLPFALVRRRLVRTAIELARGNLAGIDEQIEQTIAEGARLGVVSAAGSSLAQWLMVQLERGDVDGVIALLSTRWPRTRLEEASLALALAEARRIDEARVSLDRVATEDVGPGSQRLVIDVLAAEAAARCGSPHLDRFADSIAPHAGRCAVMSYATLSFGPIDRVRGLAALAAGRVDEAVAVLRGADEIAGSAVLWRARTQVALAKALAARGRPEDLDESARLLDAVASSPVFGDGPGSSSWLRAQHHRAADLLLASPG